GYVTAQLRLWQMDFQGRAASGRLSEIIGESVLDYDKEQRRLGMGFAAEKVQEKIKADPASMVAAQAYLDGINTYIESLNYRNMPLEFKLFSYLPEKWTFANIAYLYTYMARDLSFRQTDVEMSNALQLFGKDYFKLMYPDFPKGIDPIIPTNTEWDFEAVEIDTSAASIGDFKQDKKDQALLSPALFTKPDPDNGSNNWAVSGDKTKSGNPILCSDPHLALNLPSIWFECQLQTPDMNVYGASLPGSPGVVIGFNKDIAWGVTNAGRDVADWYRIKFKDEADKKEYQFDGEWLETSQRIEEIKVKGGKVVMDTVVYTHIGPVSYEDAENPKQNMALRWKAHEGSNEFKTFYLLNRAKNYEDYKNAIKTYECPAQNFAFAAKDGTIAMWHQGKFPVKKQGQGKMVQDGSYSSEQWQAYIPQEQNPHIVNPARGFVSSANQHPASVDYPYYYNGRFEFYRNRRLNQQLTRLKNIEVADMKKLQNDNYNLKAAEVLPVILSYLNDSTLNEKEKLSYNLLKEWNYENSVEQLAPSIFEALWKNLFDLIWDEVKAAEAITPVEYPQIYPTIQLYTTQPNHQLLDIKGTPEKENAAILAQRAFSDAVSALDNWQVNNAKEYTWGNYKGTTISHLARIMPFSLEGLATSGHRGILNATSQRHGPSWRMVVELGDSIQAYGIYPGGQSGNPGSPYYSSFVNKWVDGEYYPLWFMENAEDTNGEVLAKQAFIGR
ncbi:MAG: penicillin acylase family protein, partial [Chitinophagales bacterium]